MIVGADWSQGVGGEPEEAAGVAGSHLPDVAHRVEP